MWSDLKVKMIHNLTKFQAIPPMHSSNMSTKLKFDLFHWVKEVPKWGKSTDHDQNLISFEGGQDTWAYQLSGHSSHARKCQETSNLTSFTKSKWQQNEENQQTDAIIKLVLKVNRVHQHTKFQAISPMHSRENAQKPLKIDRRTES